MSSKSFSLLVSIPGEDPVRHDLDGDSITIGRGPDNGIQVLVAEVSVKHGEFQATEESYRLVDSGSTNGTKVNGAPVDGEGVELSPMDTVLLGSTISAYFVPSAVLESTPVAELIESIESSAGDAEKPKTEPIVAAAAPGAPAKPAAAVPAKPAVAVPVQAAAGAATVKLDEVQPTALAVGPAKPALKAPPTPGGTKPAPVKPAAPGALRPPQPAAPGGAPAAPKPAAPAAPKPAAPGAGPAAPKPVAPVPLKKPGAGGAAPAAPSIPLPKPPQKVEEDS